MSDDQSQYNVGFESGFNAATAQFARDIAEMQRALAHFQQVLAAAQWHVAERERDLDAIVSEEAVRQ